MKNSNEVRRAICRSRFSSTASGEESQLHLRYTMTGSGMPLLNEDLLLGASFALDDPLPKLKSFLFVQKSTNGPAYSNLKIY